MIRLFLANDRPVVLEGLKRIVAGCHDMQVVGDATSLKGLLAQVRAAEADILLLDVSVAGPEIFALLRQLRKKLPTTRVLVLCVEGEGLQGVRVLSTRAAGYLPRDYAPSELVAAVRKVARGAEYVSLALVGRLIAGQRGVREWPRHEALSDREFQVLCMFGAGRPFTAIARELGVSPKTVGTYRGRILKKLQLTSNADLIRYVVENRLRV